MKSDYDVIVVGAGPAGTASAMRLAACGLTVAIVESMPFPRPHVGICLSDQTLSLLNYLDLGDNFRNAGFWRRDLTAVSWGERNIKFVPQKGFHVDRGVLDQLLLDKARASGVTVYQPAHLLDTQLPDDSGWQLTIAHDSYQQILKGRFIVDATGRRSAFRNERRIKDSPPLVAFHANWTLKNPPEFDGLIESGEDAWLWYAQTAEDKAVVSVFCDPRHIKLKKCNLQTSYTRLLAQFRALPLSQFGQQCSEPQGCDASSQHAADIISDQHICVGDACFSVDPLSSQGVHLALQSGIQAAVIVNTILKKPENSGLAQEFIKMRVAEHVSRYARKAKSEYSRVALMNTGLFWVERAGDIAAPESSVTTPLIKPPPGLPQTLVTMSPDIIVERAAVIDGVFVEEHQVLRHPNIEGSIAYVANVNLPQLLSLLPQQFMYQNIPGYWAEHVSATVCSKIVSWLWSNGILIISNHSGQYDPES
uniref:FAD-binding domain-containing protein n=1 Tax=uncultured Thiotrichaceae bacterium TaxID=298394 RepID=A0A6S6UMA0_9GAMM|nr:MAG: Unknown protein [uncultured Thiotrichaceae bacterium]